MIRLLKNTIVIAFGLFTVTAFALPPKELITHNMTNYESNAFVAGTIPSQHPTHAKSDRRVYWTAVKLACFGHTTPDGLCSATIKMATNTANPLEVGTLTLNINTGELSPKQLTGNGFTLIVNGPGETTITDDCESIPNCRMPG